MKYFFVTVLAVALSNYKIKVIVAPVTVVVDDFPLVVSAVEVVIFIVVVDCCRCNFLLFLCLISFYSCCFLMCTLT